MIYRPFMCIYIRYTPFRPLSLTSIYVSNFSLPNYIKVIFSKQSIVIQTPKHLEAACHSLKPNTL